mmetsp:Transcript_734/g.1696  ORF Transcript_734/g.1696 Transcript_734/m.1696 type:complete len:237 (+) Transcript_734:584-1294(+)
MNSLHSSGQVTPEERMSSRFSKPPWKNFSSVSTDRHAAPPASYALPILTGSKLGWITPLLGDAFLTSAMSAGCPVALNCSLMAPTKSRGGGASTMEVRTSSSGNFSLRRTSSSSLDHTISSRMLRGLLSVFSMRSPFWLMASILKANPGEPFSVPTLCMDSPLGGRRRMDTSDTTGSLTDARTTEDMPRREEEARAAGADTSGAANERLRAAICEMDSTKGVDGSNSGGTHSCVGV